MASNRKPISWQTDEYVFREKTTDWYWAVGIITTSMAITSILFENYLFAIFIVLSFFTLVMFSKRKPHLLEIRLDERGIQEGRTRYLYSTLESFYVEDQLNEHKVILKSKKKIMPYIVIPIRDVDPSDVHDHLRRFLPEVEHAEPLARRIMEFLGF